MSVLLVGCGYWGQNWAKALDRLGVLSAVCDASLAVHDKLKLVYPKTQFYTALTDALLQDGIDSVILATPVALHFETARQCLLAGKSVLVEKPLTMHPDEADALVTLAENHGLTLAVGHLLLYHPAILKLKQLMDSGELGEILGIQCTRQNLGKVRNEENVWWSLAPHDLSVVSMLLGESLSVTHASGLNFLQRPDLPDGVSVQLQSASGKPVSIAVNWLSAIKRHETVVIGSEKIAIFEDTLPEPDKLQVLAYHLDYTNPAAPTAQRQATQLTRGSQAVVSYDTLTGDLLGTEAAAFLKAVSENNPALLPNDGHNGAQVVRLLQEAQQMLDRQCHQPVVTI